MQLRTTRKQAKILGIKLTSTSEIRVLRYARERIAAGKKFYIVTPNPEIVMAAQIDVSLAKVLNLADLSLPDGVGLAQAAKYLEMSRPKNILFAPLFLFLQAIVVGLATFIKRDWLLTPLNIIRGREMFLQLVKLANKRKWRVFLLGGEKGIADKTKEILSRSLKRAEIKAHQGPMLDEKASPASAKDRQVEKEAVSAINKFKPQLLFVAFGAPKQEKWIYKNLPKLNVGGAMTVGGSFDYILGRAKLPPKWMENLGLEWLWRLLTQPKRLKRILTAFPIFPLKVFWHKLRKPE